MCKYRPCWPTPEEAQRLIDAGFGHRLMQDWDNGGESGSDEFDLLCPAIIGHEGQRAPFWPTGTCTFLKDGLCELHNLGLKPGEAKEVWCKSTDQDDVHKRYGNTWNNSKAQELADRWFDNNVLHDEPNRAPQFFG